MNVNLIVGGVLLAYDKKHHIYEYAIGNKGKLPWGKNMVDMKWFKNITIGEGNNAVVMGRKTFESIGNPLKNRKNYVVSSTENKIEGVTVVKSLEDAIEDAKKKENNIDSLFVIGGGKLYNYAMENDLVDILYLDEITTNYTIMADTFFTFNKDDFDNWSLANEDVKETEDKDYVCHMKTFYRKRTTVDFDAQYLKLMNKVMTTGQQKHTRAGDTTSIFGETMSFDLRQGLPILTTKKVFSKGCIHELLWFLHGGTNIKYLVENNTHIWDDDAYRHYKQHFNDNEMTKETFIEKVLAGEKIDNYTFGDLGPVYGKQWNDWNGINQLDELIDKLKNNPDDRRLMISAWNVGELKDMALPPCHYLSQWYVTTIPPVERLDLYLAKNPGVNTEGITEETLNNAGIPTKYLSCMWMQRSVDTCLGLPYDLLSYSIFLSLVAQIVGMVPYELKCCLGDTHIYNNQMEGAIKQVNRNPYKYKYPTLTLNPDIKNIRDFKYEDIKIVGYESYSTIKYPLSVGL